MSNMRGINKDFTISKTVQEKASATSENFSVISEYIDLKLINIEVAYKTVDGVTIGKDNYQIQSDDYDLLMSDSPDFAPDKPANTYRREDLWKIIDLIRSRV